MALLARSVAQEFFPDFTRAIAEARRPGRWEFRQAAFPFVAVLVFDDRGQPLCGLVLDAANWPLRPPRVTPTSTDFRHVLSSGQIKVKRDGTEGHVYEDAKRPGQGAYFCVEGTYEFHEDYARASPWHDVRHLSEFQPEAIVDNAVELLDRTSAAGIP